MLAEIYIEALLVNEKLADQVWVAWDKGEIDDRTSTFGWTLIAINVSAVTTMLRQSFPRSIVDS